MKRWPMRRRFSYETWYFLHLTTYLGLAMAFGHEIVLTRPLVVVSALIASFSGLQFAVSRVTDESYRRDFGTEIIREIRESLAVRARYLADSPDQS